MPPSLGPAIHCASIHSPPAPLAADAAVCRRRRTATEACQCADIRFVYVHSPAVYWSNLSITCLYELCRSDTSVCRKLWICMPCGPDMLACMWAYIRRACRFITLGGDKMVALQQRQSRQMSAWSACALTSPQHHCKLCKGSTCRVCQGMAVPAMRSMLALQALDSCSGETFRALHRTLKLCTPFWAPRLYFTKTRSTLIPCPPSLEQLCFQLWPAFCHTTRYGR